MIEWVISSSVLIIMLIVIRQLFRKTLSMRVRYALWLAAALRLLIPVSFFESSLSILNLWGQRTVPKDTNAAENQDINFLYGDNLYAFRGEQSEEITFRNGLNQISAMEGTEILKLQGDDGADSDCVQDSLGAGSNEMPKSQGAVGSGRLELQEAAGVKGSELQSGMGNSSKSSMSAMSGAIGMIGMKTQDNENEKDVGLELWNDTKTANVELWGIEGDGERQAAPLSGGIKGAAEGDGRWTALYGWLRRVWIFGIFIFLGLVGITNLRYWKCVYRSRRRLQGEGESRLPVYVSAVVRMPCMFGLLHPAVYLGQEAMEEKALGYILCHENTHYRHRDNLWILVRLFCVCLHWFNPLVWLAAYLSKQDCELACDEETITRLGDENRIEYGRTLLSLSVQSGELFGGLRLSMTISGSKKQLRERLQMIAGQRKKSGGALIAVLLLMPLLFMVAFTGGKAAEALEGDKPDASAEEWGNGTYESVAGSRGEGMQEDGAGSRGTGMQESDAGSQEDGAGSQGAGMQESVSGSLRAGMQENEAAGSEVGFYKGDIVEPEREQQSTYVSVDLNDGEEYVLQVIGYPTSVNGYYEIEQINLCRKDNDQGEVLQTIDPGEVKPFYSEALQNGRQAESGGEYGSLFQSEREPLYAKTLYSIEELSAYARGQFLADGSGTQLSHFQDGGIITADLNFDGYDDFCVQIGVGSVNQPFYCYLWNPEEERFQHSVMIPNVQINQEMQLIESAAREGEDRHSVKYYRFDEAGILHMVRYVEENQSPDALFPLLDLTYQETYYALPAVDDWDAGTEYGGALNERYIYWAKEALTELYEWSGTKIDTACFAVTMHGDFYFGKTPQDLDACRSFYDRVYGVKAGFSNAIESANLKTERVTWYSPVVQWNVPEQLENMTDVQLVEWYFGHLGPEKGEMIETIESEWEGDCVIRAESGNYYEITINRVTREVDAVYGPYDHYPVH